METVLADGLAGILFTAEQLRERVRALGSAITRDYAGKTPLLVGILKGGIIFFSDIARAIDLPCQFDFIRASSYKEAAHSSGEIEVDLYNGIPMEGRDILLIEDILDTGHTLRYIMDLIRKQNPASLRLCILLDKPSRRADAARDLRVDYLGYSIPDHFVVGYGLDYAENYRNLPYIGIVKTD